MMLKQKQPKKKKRSHITSAQIIILGFLFVILMGSFFLMLPISTRDGVGASFLDALFTATSATCVTGLVLHDTAAYWSTFGQGVILLLIQIGGMGVVTVAIAIAVISGKKISLMQRSTMQEAISAPQIGGIVRMTKFILKMTFLIELIGAVLLSPVFCKDFGLLRGIWYAIFHSISAFCNAGFDLLGIRSPFSSLTAYAAVPLLNITIMLLIIIGGIGFATWADIRTHKYHFKRYRMQSKVILTVTATLILMPFLYFFFFEFTELAPEERFWGSLFQSVTPRTAGFNTLDLTCISEAGLMLIIILMLIGGSPGSTAGGMKTTTIAVLCASAAAVFQEKEQAHCFGRGLSYAVIRNAAIILLIYIVLSFGGAMVISSIEEIPLLSALFETSSAIATVGLSLGITPSLSSLSRIILIGLMFLGRVGGLTLVFAALREKEFTGFKYPEEKITVG